LEHRALSLPKDGVYFVSLAPLDAADLIVPAVAQALGFTFYGGIEPRQQLLDYLKQRHVLLILDNFEHLIEGVDLVTDALKTAPAIKILATSRAVLNVQGEHVFSVAGMDCPDPETPEDARRYSSVQFFLQSARRSQSGFELTDDVLRDVVRVCHRVEGMPLGILLAAAWVGMLTPAEIEAEIGQSLDFLETDLRDIPQRQRSMRAVFDHSWNLLSARQRAVMKALSVFRGGFTRQAAQQVVGASLRELRALVDKSLLQRDPGRRYAIHELLRQYAADKLGETPLEEEALRDRHCAYYAGFLQGREVHLLGRNQKKAAAQIEAELENVRRGWNWAVAQGKIGEINRFLEGLGEFYWVRTWLQQGKEVFARVAQTLEEKLESRLGPVRSASLRDADAEPVAGAADAQEEITNRRSITVLSKALLQQGRFCVMLGLGEEASEPLQKSLAISRDLDARREIAYALRWLGHNAASPEEKRRLLLEGLAIFEEIGDRRGVLYSLWGLGNAADLQGEYEAGKQLYQESLTLSRELDNQLEISHSLRNLGVTAGGLGQYGLAKQLHQKSLALCREIGDFWGVADSLRFLARDYWGLEKFGEAEQLLQKSLAIYREIANPRGIAEVLGDLGEVANVLGEHTEAIQFAQEGLTLLKKLDLRYAVAWSFRVLGNAACGLRDFQGARRYFQQALEIIMTDRLTAEALYTLAGVAVLLAAEGDREGGLELLGLVLHHPASAQWTRDRAETLLADVEAELPPEVVAAAQERGRARGLEATVAELLTALETGVKSQT
jgi:predicted ATPase